MLPVAPLRSPIVALSIVGHEAATCLEADMRTRIHGSLSFATSPIHCEVHYIIM